MRRRGAALTVWALLAIPTAHAACDPPASVRFASGANGANLDGGIARGETACFTLGAQAGQTVAVTQRDKGEGNIVLQLYRPGWKITQSAEDGVTVRGTALPGAEEGKDAPAWSGRLPATGTYLLVLGTTRGGGVYRMRIEIR